MTSWQVAYSHLYRAYRCLLHAGKLEDDTTREEIQRLLNVKWKKFEDVVDGGQDKALAMTAPSDQDISGFVVWWSLRLMRCGGV